MDLAAVEAMAADRHLAVFGGFHPGPDDRVPHDAGTLLLLGPKEPGFWPHVSAEPEFADQRPDPLDRWSRRIIGQLACDLGAKALFPFGGPPWHPFIAWAKRTDRAWQSPVALLVHDQAGLMVSYRGALALKDRIALPDPPAAAPCETCPQPCRSACPVDALQEGRYDTDACHAFLDTPDGAECLTQGCRARRACPVSRAYGRNPAQSAFHMAVFHPGASA